ncbi:response regulator transcription factor [Arthrobacter sunyaminii]|uniref:Response regulator transcription factor n=1 Tax=Arthrobacter sunyaminii TaxID=2816859 RepID=A0A975S622_9MICC|nr:response regulator transcription factor [Arthrobacter sunyaminii]MBO0909675.1 response regulator transcription factor [Arthrobacter sunyaminii]QWQ36481.1 response regulator transcription factor [Arthrobacter sunyaminii]
MRVLLCDDHPVYRDGLRALFDELGVEVVAEAASGEEAVMLVAACEPDIVVMDLSMPGMGGVEATRRIVAEHPLVRVLALTMVDEPATMLAALRAGASGYLLKGAGHAEIQAALDAVESGGMTIAPEVAQGLRAGLRPPEPFPQLTPRERDVLGLMSRGRTNEHIADVLVLSVKTVRNVVSGIFPKLGVTTRAQAVAAARDAGVDGAEASAP